MKPCGVLRQSGNPPADQVGERDDGPGLDPPAVVELELAGVGRDRAGAGDELDAASVEEAAPPPSRPSAPKASSGAASGEVITTCARTPRSRRRAAARIASS